MPQPQQQQPQKGQRGVTYVQHPQQYVQGGGIQGGMDMPQPQQQQPQQGQRGVTYVQHPQQYELRDDIVENNSL